jgi:hypothetical protein
MRGLGFGAVERPGGEREWIWKVMGLSVQRKKRKSGKL